MSIKVRSKQAPGLVRHAAEKNPSLKEATVILPLTVLQKILLGALKWYGPREGLVFILLRRKARYFTIHKTGAVHHQAKP